MYIASTYRLLHSRGSFSPGFQRALDRVALLPILSALVAAHCYSKESSKAAMNSCEF